MRNKHRKIVVRNVQLNWTRWHSHKTDADGNRICIEHFSAHTPHSRLSIIFNGSEGSLLSGGWGHDGAVGIKDYAFNLNLPSIVAMLISFAMKKGWDPIGSKELQIPNGFLFLDDYFTETPEEENVIIQNMNKVNM